jgi:hypothetical protein
MVYMFYRTIYFTRPILTNKVRLDQLEGARDIAFKIEFLGLDMTTKNLSDSPQQSRAVSKGKKGIPEQKISRCFGLSSPT